MQTVSSRQVETGIESVEEPLPPRVQEALGQLVGAAKEGLLALSVGVGLGVLESLMAEEVEEVCGPKGRHDPGRVAYRHGTDDGEVTLGGRRVPITRPRMRKKDGDEEVPVRTYEHFAARDQLTGVVMERMLAGAIIAGLGGSVAVAASLLNAHTGYYPTKHGVAVNMSGPGEALNSRAANFCRVAFQVSNDIPFPPRYASWRAYVLTLNFGIKHPTSSIPCGAHAGYVTAGWLGQWFATTAFCGWAQAWATPDVDAGNRAAAARDARAILSALDWRAVRWVDPHPDTSSTLRSTTTRAPCCTRHSTRCPRAIARS